MEPQLKESLPVKKASLLSVLFSPAEEFLKLRENPRIGLPMVWITLIMALLLAAQNYFILQNPELANQVFSQHQGLEGMDMETIKNISIVSVAIGSLIFISLALVVGTFFTWLFVTLFQGDATFKQLLSLHVFMMPVYVLSTVVGLLALALFGLDPSVPVTSLASLFSAEGTWKLLLTPLDIFSIWGVFLFAIGLREVARLPQSKAWIIALIFYAAQFILTYFLGSILI